MTENPPGSRLILTFHSIYAALRFESLAKNTIPIALIPAPREITSSCATAAQIPPGFSAVAKQIVKENRLEIDGFYLLPF